MIRPLELTAIPAGDEALRGEVRAFLDRELRELPAGRRARSWLGYDAAFSARLDGKNSAIKAVLLDQKVLAGVGNIYADESLFAAGIDPRRKALALTRLQAARLLQCLQDVLLLSISQCGSSIRDYRDADGNVGAFQNTFAVYGRGGQECKTCGRPLEKTRVAGRSTVFCPHCQR